MKTEHMIHSLEELDAYAQIVAKNCPASFFLALHGDLGAGKTTFVKCLGKAWGINDVRSPSFDVVHVHNGLRRLIHMDAYRLNQGSLDAFNIEDLCVPPFCLVVEWPECLQQGAIPFQQHLHFSILPDGSRKIVSISDEAGVALRDLL